MKGLTRGCGRLPPQTDGALELHRGVHCWGNAWQANVEIVTEKLANCIDATSRLITVNLNQRIPANMADASLWHERQPTFISEGAALWCRHAGLREPPGQLGSVGSLRRHRWRGTTGEIKQLRSWYEEMIITVDEERLAELADNILRPLKPWVIGTVKVSIPNRDQQGCPEFPADRLLGMGYSVDLFPIQRKSGWTARINRAVADQRPSPLNGAAARQQGG